MTYNTNIIINLINDFFVNNNKENSNAENEEPNNNLNIKGQWGSGKTTYIKKLNTELELQKEYQVKIFNVWEYEISDNIFVSILCDILNLVYDVKNENEKNKQGLKTTIKNLAIITGYGLTYALDYWVPSMGAMIRGCWNKKQKAEKNDQNNKGDIDDPLFELITTNKYYELLNDTIKIIKDLIGDKKYIIIFDELDRCTTPKMIEFLSIIKNILFKLNNCFFIVSCDSDRINKMLTENGNGNKGENYTDKIFNNSINIKYLVSFDPKNIENNKAEELIKNNFFIKDTMENGNENEFRKNKKVLLKTTEFLNNFYSNKNSDLFEYFVFWILKIKENNLKKYEQFLLNSKINYIEEINNKLNNKEIKLNLDEKNKRMHELTSLLGQDPNELEKETLSSINSNKEPLNLIQINFDENLTIDLFNFIPFIKDFNQIKQINANKYNYDRKIHLYINYDDLKINLDEDFIYFIDFIYKNINKIKLINNNINILNDKKINCFFNKTIFDFHV